MLCSYFFVICECIPLKIGSKDVLLKGIYINILHRIKKGIIEIMWNIRTMIIIIFFKLYL